MLVTVTELQGGGFQALEIKNKSPYKYERAVAPISGRT